MYFRFIKVNFPFTKREGKRRKLSFPSTVDNFRDTFRSPQYSFIASYDAKNELKRGIITLLPKKDKPTDVLNNLRPVTLLNVDYKIATKVIANRLAKVLPDIICPNQTGYVKNRYIGENVRLIADIIDYIKKEKKYKESPYS